MFTDRRIVIATKHHKEQVIQPILEANLGCTCILAENLDTDLLGTFSGEIERSDDPIATARKKCELAMELTNSDMAIASEGSFGPHPSYFFANADDEFIVFIDKKNNLEIVVRELSLDTNFNADYLTDKKKLIEFATNAKFPSHALILRKAPDELENISKGITDWYELFLKFNYLKEDFSKVYVETDMRAMYNPTRMEVIRQLTLKLVDKINSTCPICSTPGFGVTEVKDGLPCSNCHFPTRSIKSHIYSCLKCDFKEEKQFPKEKQFEDPMYCDICNP
jgi:hypothetical protein